MSNLRLINETTAIAGVTTINITDIFSADYDIYKIVFTTDGNSTTAFDVDLSKDIEPLDTTLSACVEPSARIETV